jgi:predicted GIY-YIG superfamily endonuclease
MTDNYKVYGITDPENGMVRYIGATKSNLNRRLYEHSIDFARTKKANWFSSLSQKGAKPIIILFEDGLNENDALKKEVEYIQLFKSFGANLLNLTNGGKNPPNMSGIPMSEETKKKISESNKIAQIGKRVGVENYKSKPVAQIDKETGVILAVFPSILQAYKFTNVSRSSIQKFLWGIRKYGGGYNWKFISRDDYFSYPLKNISTNKLITWPR